MTVQPIVIGGVSIDASDPCAVAAALKRVRLQLATGGGVVVTRFDEDEVRFAPGNLSALDRLISKYDGECALATGQKRVRRYAKRATFL